MKYDKDDQHEVQQPTDRLHDGCDGCYDGCSGNVWLSVFALSHTHTKNPINWIESVRHIYPLFLHFFKEYLFSYSNSERKKRLIFLLGKFSSIATHFPLSIFNYNLELDLQISTSPHPNLKITSNRVISSIFHPITSSWLQVADLPPSQAPELLYQLQTQEPTHQIHIITYSSSTQPTYSQLPTMRMFFGSNPSCLI